VPKPQGRGSNDQRLIIRQPPAPVLTDGLSPVGLRLGVGRGFGFGAGFGTGFLCGAGFGFGAGFLAAGGSESGTPQLAVWYLKDSHTVLLQAVCRSGPSQALA
jgi:hypothetical protein